MALPDLRGKTKKDLSAIAHIGGLLTPSDTSRMTKQQLIDYLTRMAEESELSLEAPAAPPAPDETVQEAEAAEPQPVPEDPKAEKEEEKPESQEAKPKVRKTGTRRGAKGQVKEKSSLAGQAEGELEGSPEKTEAPEDGEDAGLEDGKAEEKHETVTGVLEVMPEGYGFLRIENYIQSNRDIYVPPQYVRRFGLRTGDLVTGPVRQQRENDRYRALFYIREVNNEAPEKMIRRPHFDRLTPIYPKERYKLETVREELSTRVIDLVCPIGKGQRGMIVSPPKAGKTILLQKIANAITLNNPQVKLIVLLIDERPEEVTDMQRSIDGEVVYSTFDKTPENHVRITELVLERAMRLVELGNDVVILLDSITRMGRAYNLTINPTGRTLSGGLDPGALYGPKRFFGAARNIENGGSLTIIATALIETGSRMDEVIFEEFKGTGNMEVILDRKLADKRIFPAIDVTRSGTRREELLLSERELDAIWLLRKTFAQLETAAVTETMLSLLMKTRDNDQFISSINVSMTDKSLFDAMRGGMPKRDTGNHVNERERNGQ